MNIEVYKDTIKKKNHKNILEIREIIKSYNKVGKISPWRNTNDSR